MRPNSGTHQIQNRGHDMNGVSEQFENAVEVANHALEEFNREPLVDSKRGGPRLSPWWRVWVQASELAARWYRELARERRERSGESLDDELDRLIRAQEGRGREGDA